MEFKNRVEKFNMLSFKSMYNGTGIEQKVSYELMYKTFKERVVRTKETHEEYLKGDAEFRQNVKIKRFHYGATLNNGSIIPF